MARGVKPGEPYFLFDRQEEDQAIVKEERPGFLHRLKSFVSSRYALLSIIFLLSGSLIFYNTAALQFNPAVATGIGETTGVPRQQVIKAPRGDIVDASGLPLAYSKPLNVLQLTYAGLDAGPLNNMLLDLALLLESYEVNWQNELEDFLQLSHEGCVHEEGGEDECGEPVFMLAWDDILYWQTKSGVFPLKDGSAGKAAWDNHIVKPDAGMFYDYLLYNLFSIENPDADGQKYSQADAWRIMGLRYLIHENNWAFINGTPIELARHVDDALVQIINEQNYRFMGVITAIDYERQYTDAASSLSHVMGYVGSISKEQYYNWASIGYAANAIVGKDGVELTAERYLAGQDGIKPYNIWSVAGASGAFYSEQIGRDAMPGYDVRLTIDLELQTVAEHSLRSVIEQIRNSPGNKNKGDADAGAVVMIDVKTGAILAMVSEPGYDPNDFVLQQYDTDAADRVRQYLTDQVSKPMLNRAIMEIYAPGSTFKPATATAALESGAVTPTSNTIRCVGHEVIGDWLWYCLERPSYGHGNLTLTEAMATSCNLYFFNLGVRTGINSIDEWGQKLGLGEYTGIDLPGEAKGFRASRETKKLLRSNPEDQIWFPADTCQSAIGQFDNSFTILQLAVYTAALATGNRVTPYVIDAITRQDGVIIRDSKTEPVPIGLKESTLEAVRKGMINVVSSSEGTAYRAFRDFPIPVAAKTGTAETGFEDRSSSNGLFICYAPADDPQVAIAQIVEKGAWGSNTIGIARDLLAAYFHLDEAEATQTRPYEPGLPDFVPSPIPTEAARR
ncbi:MAG: penicillin-binding transpeptidase domain-containing protein [Bacillota bacterium]|nr:penicillin-binding transpeptidase domain-containing protein [Bacillota bacterium]